MSWKKIMLALGLALYATIGGSGCAGLGPAPKAYDYFATPGPSDVWSWKIGQWQNRAQADGPVMLRETATVSTPSVAVVDPGSAEVDNSVPLVLLLPEDSPGEVVPVKVVPTAAQGRPGNGLPTGPQVDPSRVLVSGDPSATADAAASLRKKYSDFRSERRRALARELSEWIQGQALIHYKADGPIDRWATLEETLGSNGDDCDGLELLVYDALLSLGFDREEVFRAVVYRPMDLQHHMVTLWFEDPLDPWVIDPTGAMTNHMQRMSELPGWVPLKVFGLYREFTVQPATRELARSGSRPVAVAQR